MNVYDVHRDGRYVRQITACNRQEAERWVRQFMPSCTVRFAYRIGDDGYSASEWIREGLGHDAR